MSTPPPAKKVRPTASSSPLAQLVRAGPQMRLLLPEDIGEPLSGPLRAMADLQKAEEPRPPQLERVYQALSMLLMQLPKGGFPTRDQVASKPKPYLGRCAMADLEKAIQPYLEAEDPVKLVREDMAKSACTRVDTLIQLVILRHRCVHSFLNRAPGVEEALFECLD